MNTLTVDTLLDYSPYARLIGMQLTEADGELRFSLPFHPDNIGNDPDCAWKKITLQISVMTSVFIDESDSNVAAIDPDAATNHAQTVGTVSALLQSYEPMATIETAPAQIFGWEPSGGQDLQVEKHFETAIIYTASAAPWFAPE